jgi:hypothetical protein
MNFRKELAKLICPELEVESDRLHWLLVQIADKRQWLGYDYPVVAVTLERLLADDAHYWRPEGCPSRELTTAEGFWPHDISAFRDKLRRHFAPAPRPQPAKDRPR